MGVQGLWTLLEPCGKRVSVEALSNRKLAVDASIWLVQFLAAMRNEKGEQLRNAHVLGFFRRICKLLFNKVRPVFVFDGATPALKRATTAARRRRREQQGVRLKKTAEKLLLSQLKKHALEKAMAATRVVGVQPKGGESSGKPKPPKQSAPREPEKPRQKRKEGYEEDVVEVLSDDDEGEFLLPDDMNSVDPTVLSTLPPSIQLEVMEKMREQKTSENRERFHRASSAPSNFSNLQFETYLQGCSFRKQMDGIKDQMNAVHSGKGKGKRIASERDREYILKTTPVDTSLPGSSSIIMGGSRDEAGPSSLFLSDPPREENAPAKRGQAQGGSEREGLDLDIKVELKRDKESSSDDDLGFGSDDTSHESDGVEWEPVEDASAAVRPEVPRGQQAAPVHWRQRAAERQKFWSRTHGFQMGRKLGDWSEQDKKAKPQGPSGKDIENFELERAIEMSLKDSKGPREIEDRELAKAIELSQAEMPNEGGDESDSDLVFEDAVDGTKCKELGEGGDFAITAIGGSSGGAEPAKEDPSSGPEERGEQEKASEQHVDDAQAPLRRDDALTEDVENRQREGSAGLGGTGGGSGGVQGQEPVAMPRADRTKVEKKRVAKCSSEGEIVAIPAKESSEGHDVADKDAVAKEEAVVVSPSPAASAPEPSSDNVIDLVDSRDEDEGAEAEAAEAAISDGVVGEEEGPVLGSREVEVGEVVDLRDSPEAEPAEEPNATRPQQQPKQQNSRANMETMERELKHVDEDIEKLTEEYKRTVRYADEPTAEMYAECQELLTIFGIPYIIAPMEAEAQCAYLNKEGLVDGVVTDDSDAFLFGATSVYRNIFEGKKYVEEYRMSDIAKELALSRENLIELALLLGSDYTEGVYGVGIVNAIEIVNEFPGVQGLKKFKEWVEKFDNRLQYSKKPPSEEGTTEFMRKHSAVRKNWDIPSDFPSEKVMQEYRSPKIDLSKDSFRWGRPDMQHLLAFCAGKFSWPTEKTRELLEPVLKAYEAQEMQLRLDSFFSFSERFAKFRSKRIEKAVSKLKKRKADDGDDDMAVEEVAVEEPSRKKAKGSRKGGGK
ncbi:XPG/Rad2 endonuclease [Chloropicon primus]|nr:XPG/Rad2 endonuclease [Chloropicon primus]